MLRAVLRNQYTTDTAYLAHARHRKAARKCFIQPMHHRLTGLAIELYPRAHIIKVSSPLYVYTHASDSFFYEPDA